MCTLHQLQSPLKDATVGLDRVVVGMAAASISASGKTSFHFDDVITIGLPNRQDPLTLISNSLKRTLLNE